MHKHAFSLIALSCAIAVPGTTYAEDGSVEADLRARVAELERIVERLDAGDNWMTEERAAGVRSIVQDVLADADTRASLLQGGASGGHDGKKFYLVDGDGNFKLNIEGQIQTRFVFNMQDDMAASDGDEKRYGFEIRRMKLKFKGHVVDPSWKYGITGAFSRSDGEFHLEDAYVNKVLNDNWDIKFGQFKFPFMKEELNSSSKQLAVDRTFVNEFFNQDFSQGVQVGYTHEQFRAKAAFGDGFGSDNTAALAFDTEYAFTGRAEVRFGDASFKQFDDFTAWEGDDDGVLIGGAIHYQESESGTSAFETELLSATADISLEMHPFNAFASIVFADIESNAPGSSDVSPWGFTIQAGYHFVPNEWEVFARYEYIDPDVSGVDELSIATVGVNRYFSKHQLKWTTDLGFAFDTVFDSESGIGYREDNSDEDGQVVIRSQFQLLF